tara:strand:- start:39 stop:248 length:210 start_codon:yes stop_codon:yes gene_type:complete
MWRVTEFAWLVGPHGIILNTLTWRPLLRRSRQRLKYGDARSIPVMRMDYQMDQNQYVLKEIVQTTPEVI